MAIISFTNYKRGQTTGCMSAVMRYTMQDKKTEFEGQQLVTGINCQPESVYAVYCSITWYRASRKAKLSTRSPLTRPR